MRLDLRSCWLAVFLALAGGCKDAGPPPHPPPDPELDIVVRGQAITINGQPIDVTSASVGALERAVGHEPSERDESGAAWRSQGLEVVIDSGGVVLALRVTFQPYGIALDEGMQPFRGRLIINGAWVHPAMEINHLEKELGHPCNPGNQGWGRFHREPFDSSWGCNVGGTNVVYWMKYISDLHPPLAAFDIVYREQKFPEQPPPPAKLEGGWTDLKNHLENLF